VTNNAILAFNRSDDITVGNVIGGTGSLTKLGGGILTLSGANTFTGGIDLASGTLRLENNLAAGGAGSVIRTTGSVIDYADGIDSATPIAVNSNTTQLQVLTGNATQSGVISEVGGPRGIEKTGNGTLRLSGANTYSGGTTITDGTLEIDSDGNLGAAAGGVTIADGRLRVLGAGLTLTRDFELTSAAGISSDTGTTVIFSAITGAGSLTTSGNGVLVLRGTNTYAGRTTVAGRALVVTSDANLGAAGGNVSFAGGLLQIEGNLAGTRQLTWSSDSRISVGSGFTASFDTLGGGFGTLTKIGAGTLVFTGTGGGLGTFALQEGTVITRTADAMGIGTFRVTGSGTKLVGDFTGTLGKQVFVPGAFDTTIAATTGNAVTLQNLALGDAATIRFGTAAENGTIVLGLGEGVGLSPSNRPKVMVDAGTLQIGTDPQSATRADFLLSNAALVNIATGATLDVNGASVTVRGLEGSGTLGNTGGSATIQLLNSGVFTGTIDTGANDLRLGGPLGGDSSITKTGTGTLTLAGTFNYTGPTSVNAGTLALETVNAGRFDIGGRIILDGGNLLTTSTGTLGNDVLVASTRSANISAAAGTTLTIGGSRLTYSGGPGTTLTFGSASNTGTVVLAPGGTTFDTRGKLAVAGGTLRLANNAFDSANFFFNFLRGGVTVGTDTAPATLELDGSRPLPLTINNLSGSSAGLITNGGATLASLTLNNGADTTFAGVIADGVGGILVAKTGAGTLTLTGAQTYTGGTFVSGGTLVVNGSLASNVIINGGTLGGSGSIAGGVTVNSGGTLAAGNSPGTMTVGSLTLNSGSLTSFELGERGVAGGPNNDLIVVTGALTLNGGNIEIVQNTGFTNGRYTLFEFGSLAGALGNLTLNPLAGGFLGTLAVDGNTIILNAAPPEDLIYWNGSTLASTGAVEGGSGTWNFTNGNFTDDDGIYTGPWAGNGFNAVFAGTGGTVTIDADTTVAPSGLAFLADGYVINGGNAASRLELTGATGIDTAAGIGATINAVISGAGSLTKTGDGTLTLGGANTYTGDTSVLGGTLVNSGTIAGIVRNSATFTSTGTLSGELINNAGATANVAGTARALSNSGVLNITGNLDATGDLNNVPSGTVTVNAGATANITGLISNQGTAANAFTVNGTLTATGQFINQFGGNLLIGTSGSLGAGGRVINGGGATLVNNGTITSEVFTTGTFTSTGTLQAGLELGALSATADLEGVVTGTVINPGTINLTGTTTGITLLNIGGLGTFNLNGFSTSLGSLTGDGTVNLGAATLTVGSANTSTSFGGTINGTGGLIKEGTGTFTLTRQNFYTGLTRVDAGTLALGAGGRITGRVRNDATFTNAGTVAGGVTNTATLTSTGTINNGLSQFAGATATVSGTLNGFVSNAGSLTVNGNLASNDFGQITGAGQVQINSGARWSGLLGFTNASTNAAGMTISGTLDVSGIYVTQAGATTVIASGGTLTAQNSANLGTVTNNGTVNTDVTNGSGTDIGTITNNGTWNGTLSQGRGSVTNGGTWNGNFLLDAGGTITNNGRWDITAPFGSSLNDGTFDNNGTLAGNGFFVTGSTARLNNNTGGVISLTAGQAFNISSGGTLTNAGSASAIANVNAGGILRNNAGASWTGAVNIAATGSATNAGVITGNVGNAGSFTSTNTLIGTLTNNSGGTASLVGTVDGNIINNGTITLTGATVGIDRVTVNTGGIFNLAGFSTTFGGLAGNGGEVRLGSATLTVDTSAGSTAFSGVISGSGGLTKTGTQTLTLSGVNTFTGLTTINGGSISLATGASLAGGVENNATFTNSGQVFGLVTNNATLVSTGRLAGGLTNNAGATASLAGRVIGTILNAGSITLTADLSGSPALSQQAGGAFNLAGFNASLGSIAGSGTITLGSGSLTVGGNNTSTTFAGVISGTGRLFKLGTGTLTLTGVNTYTGDTQVSEGALTLAAGGVIAGRVNNFATFTNAGTVSGRVGNAGSFISTGIVNGGLFQVAGADATVRGTLNGAIDSAGSLTIDGNLAGDGILTNSGTGTVVVRGAASVTGLAGVDNASTALNGLTIAGSLQTGGTVVNRAGASIFVGGGASLEAANMANLGTFTNNGTVTSDVTNSGTIQNNATWNGTLSQGTGSATNGGTWNGAFLVDAGGTVTNNGRWSNFTGFLSAVNNCLFENFGLLSGGGVNVTGAEARLANRAGGTIQLATGQFLRAESDGIITNAGTISGGGIVNADGVIQNLAGGRWDGAFSVAATGSLTNAGTITGNILNFGSFASTGTVNGSLVNEEGAGADLSGNVNGDIFNAGSVTLTGTTSGIRLLDQSSTGAFDLAGFDTRIGRLSGAGDILLRSATLTVGTAVASTSFNGVISGSGGLVKTGSLSLFLNGANTYTGLTTVNQGGLVVGAGGSLAGSVRNNATLINGGTIGGSVTNFGTFLNVGRILGSLTNNATVQLAGQIDGSVTNNGSITNAGGAIVLGRFTQAADSSLDLAGFNSSFGSLAGGGTIALGSAFLTVGGDNTSSAFDGVIGGTGGLVKVGTGSFTLNGVNTYTGTTFVNAGTLVVGAGDVVVAPPPPPAQTIAPAASLLSTQSESGGALLVGGTANLTGGRTSVTLSGSEPAPELIAAVAGEAPAAPFAAVTAQATMLAPAVIAGNVVNSATLVNNGTILGMVINNAGASASNVGVIRGAVRNDGTLVSTGTLGGGLVNNGDAQIEGVLDGDVVNAGTITLTGATTGIDIFEQTAAGSLDLAGFNTTIGAITGAGEITLGSARLTTGTDGIGTVFSGEISGTGSLVKVGTGRLVLSGANTYTGGTTISGGVLQLGNGGTAGSIVGPVVNNGALVINRSNAYTFANVISGTGMFVQDGTGTTTLLGANTYSGGTLVSRGRLVGNTTSLQGQIQNNAALEFAQAANGTFAGQLFGTGLFDKTAAGILTLTGNSNGFTGGTFVRAGELRVTGGLANSVVTVLSGSTLSGTGTIGGLVANSGSIVAPGANGAGTLGVNGAVNLQAGSTTQLQIRANGASDAIVSNGAATLGGTAAFSNLGGVYAFNSEIVLLQADGGRSGTFANATGFDSFGILYRPQLVYTATQARLRFAPNLLANIVGNTALTANQRSVVNRIDGAVTAGYNPQPLFNIYALPTGQLPNAFDQISGEVYATAAGVGIEQERLLREAVLGRVNAVASAARGDAAAGKGAAAWGQVFVGRGQVDSDGNAARFEADRTGFATGIDFGNANENGSWRAGVFGMHIQSDVTIDARGSSAKVEQSGGGVYASLSTGGFSATLGGYLTSVDLTATRTIALPTYAELDTGETGGEAKQAFAELSYTIPAGKGMIRPFVGATIGSFDLDAFTETGGAAALTMRDQSYSTGTLTGGVDATVPVSRSVTLSGMLAGRAQLGDRDPQAVLALAAAPNQAFGVAGAQFDEVALSARLDAAIRLGKNVDLSVGYTGLIGSTVSDHGARATLQVQF